MAKTEFKLKNYTTSIAADRSIMEIEQMLAKFGASAVMKQYLSDATCYALSFKLEEKGYKLPANWEGVHAILWGQKGRGTRPTPQRKREDQSKRVAWRIIHDWLHSQLSLIASGQAQPDEILLPYQYDGKRTLYEAYKQNRLQISPAPAQDDIASGSVSTEANP